MWRSPSRSSSKYWPPPSRRRAAATGDRGATRSASPESIDRRCRRRRLKDRHRAAGQRADADDEDRDAAAGRRRFRRVGDLAAPGLAVGQQDEHLRVRRLAVQFLVALDDAQAPVDAELEVGVPGRVVLDAERRLLVEMIEEEEERVRIAASAGSAARRCARRRASAMRSFFQLERVAERAEEAHRSLPAVAGDVLHAHRRRAVLQDDEVEAALAHDRRRPVRARPARR